MRSSSRAAPASPPAPAPTLRLRRDVPPELYPAVLPLLRVARNLGVGVSGTRGIGKSQLLRVMAWMDMVYHRTPVIVIDPIGAVIDGLLGHICHFHEDDQRELWRRIRYVNMSPTDHVIPTPLYYRTGLGKETLFAVSQRLPDALGRLDPNLREASIQGFNSLWEVATHAGQLLYAVGCQPSELDSFLAAPDAWLPRVDEAIRANPALAEELADSLDFFRTTFPQLTPANQRQRTAALRTKLTLLTEPATKALFCAAAPGIDWQEVMREKLVVLFDLRNEHEREPRQFKLLWLFLSIVDFVRRFGAEHSGDRRQPLSLVIDEITFLFGQRSSAGSPVVDDLDGLINRLSRNYNVWVTTSFQEVFQLPSGMRQTLLSLGTQFYGRMTDLGSLRAVADRTFDYDPHLIKKTVDRTNRYGEIYDSRTEEYSVSEQRQLNFERLANLRKYEFAVTRTLREGDAPLPLERFSVAPFAAKRFPPAPLLAQVRRDLSQRDGVPVETVLAEIERRKSPPPPAAAIPPPNGPRPDATPRPSRRRVVLSRNGEQGGCQK